nr:PQQ-dependent sugar dehydrogenase [Angustibacter aerolatus]
MGRPLLVALLAGALLAVPACSAATDDDAAPRAGSGTSPASSTPASAPASPSVPAASTSGASTGTATRVTGEQVLARDLRVPWGLVPMADGSVLVSQRDEATVVRVQPDGEVVRLRATGPDGRVPGVVPGGEGGLLGIAVDPDDPTRLFAYLTAEADNRVVRMSLDGDRLGAPRVLLDGIPKAGNHDGGRLAFGPDGYLYVTTGDAGQRERAQDRRFLGGKILRITTDGDPAPGNPFAGSPVWTLGHRNVQGIGWDAQGRMYADEFGQDTWDEPEPDRTRPRLRLAAGRGRRHRRRRRPGFTPPLRQWRTDDASPSGLAVGRGSVWLAALAGQRVWRVPLTGSGGAGRPESLLEGRHGRLRAVAFDRDGTLLALTSNTFRGTPRPGDDQAAAAHAGLTRGADAAIRASSAGGSAAGTAAPYSQPWPNSAPVSRTRSCCGPVSMPSTQTSIGRAAPRSTTARRIAAERWSVSTPSVIERSTFRIVAGSRPR